MNQSHSFFLFQILNVTTWPTVCTASTPSVVRTTAARKDSTPSSIVQIMASSLSNRWSSLMTPMQTLAHRPYHLDANVSDHWRRLIILPSLEGGVQMVHSAKNAKTHRNLKHIQGHSTKRLPKLSHSGIIEIVHQLAPMVQYLF